MEIQNDLPKTFDPQGAEDKWYQKWLDKKVFKPVPGKQKKTFTVLMPPPNVTGKLHMGHALDATTQDALIRYKRMKGFETLWIPGTDHAGISTQAVVEKLIWKQEKKNRHDLGREEFTKRIWAWKEQYGSEIVNQQKKMGVSCDWDYSTFTLDDIPNKAVKKFFVMLYNEGLIYQSDYIVNWDPVLQSAISDAEVEHKEVKGFFYYLKYKVKEDPDMELIIATTRPETIFADTAVAVNPNDERFKDLIGKTAIVPICNREVPIIGDEHVDIEKGTGCLKVTPGHDFNDFEIGKRNGLPIINILNKDGTFNKNAPEIEGLKPKDARAEVERILTELGSLVEKKDHVHPVGHGERSDEIVEPMVSKQWFLNTTEMARVAVEAVEQGDMSFFPKGWENTYFAWLRNPKDWCISRQLWWGHQIPVYYCRHCDTQWAAEEAPTQCIECKDTDIFQDPDVLDTWFSSGLWPLSTLGWPDEKAMEEKGFDKFYPNETLITGFDIIFFWVARMMMMGMKVTGKAPFKHTYIHAIVRDKQGRKMSKSLGNGIDPLDMVQQYGCDAMRFTLAAGSGYNRDLNLDPERIEGYRNFVNKLWNAFRFVYPFLDKAKDELPVKSEWHLHDKWILAELNTVAKTMNEAFDVYRFDDASAEIYSFVYDKFCSWYIELSKNILYGNDEKAKIIRATMLKYCFKKIVNLLHPITPFITEEIWSYFDDKSLVATQEYVEFDKSLENAEVQEMMNKFIDITTGIRNIRSSVNMKPKDEIDVKLFTDDKKLAKFVYESRHFLKDLANVKSGTIRNKAQEKPKKSASLATAHTEIFIPLEGIIDLNEQVNRIKKDMEKTQNEYKKVESKLNNQNFMANAPEEVRAEVQEKAKLFQDKLQSLNQILDSFL
ncbi:valine--tRNA ligase [Peredibacter starrii]|uniref:Valine--tRNA ligase n=1 Tax=Peredibacter starrii TaxID=28202 RepID=A0AAX4HR10_9BACT|nr:valine--tRNA ligase [Peredibacter starrii]WPU65729.1 valine--tRNA ligase [Peredibacter starrii]